MPSSSRFTLGGAHAKALFVVGILILSSCAPYLGPARVPRSAALRALLPADLFEEGEEVLLVPLWEQASGGSTIHDPKHEKFVLGPLVIARREEIDEVLGGLRGPRRAGLVYIDGRGGDIAGRSVRFHGVLIVGGRGGAVFATHRVREWWGIYRGAIGSVWRDQLESLLLTQSGTGRQPPDDHILCPLSRPVVLRSGSAQQDRIEAFLGNLQPVQGPTDRWSVFKKRSGYSTLCGGALNRGDEKPIGKAPRVEEPTGEEPGERLSDAGR